ncbi:winged helix-turn-helix domain-containing protein [Curtobacterium ammoniigenes]|uniref:winged helix-turn-helix domain-containing protein n=1 Tax=Curtobacterium ammoniigenes TaxID=395387 RepID=UPI00082BFC4D|nr:crosslink repair DNA glycosylase YcaQ family protein [Curtobacterium ammoniigenes]
MPSHSTLSRADARRLVLGAQGFARQSERMAPGAEPLRSARSLTSCIGALGLLQIDSVNVFERSHYLPLFARRGPYDRTVLDRATVDAGARHVEYWAHEAAFIPRAMLPLFRWKMDALRARDHEAGRTPFVEDRAPLMRELLAVLAANGPMAASEIEHESNVRHGPWWGWSDVKRSLEFLFRWGDVVSAGRRGFERVYALPDHVLPPGYLDAAPERADGIRSLVEHAVRASGVGTVADLADYFRLRTDDTKRALLDLQSAGSVVPVAVEGWSQPAWMHVDARIPRRISASAILSPFDPVVWFRPRAERLWDFRYRIEIYTPAPKRVYGYYVLPVLQDEHIVGRVDLKSDRQRRALLVRAAWREPDAPFDADRLAETLRMAARWQGLDTIEVSDHGTAAAELAAAVTRVERRAG